MCVWGGMCLYVCVSLVLQPKVTGAMELRVCVCVCVCICVCQPCFAA